MAEDVISLLDHLGWTGERDLHVVGLSLGGMVAQGTLPQVVVSLEHYICR
jgi:pimeloyl-ACP methyl ester carboxylesterase